jgi:cytochrome P450
MASAAQSIQLNPVSPENLLDPVPLYRELRANAPVLWSDMLHAWFITRHDDVMNCFRDTRLTGDRRKLFELQLGGMGPDVIGVFLESLSNQVGMRDGRDHLRLRRQMNPGFTPQVIDSWRPAIRRTMNALLDEVQDRGRMDLVEDVSKQLPPFVIAEIFGVPAEDRKRFLGWAEPLATLASPPLGSDMMVVARQANEAAREFNEYLTQLIEQRRRSPEHDVVSLMIHAQQEGQMSPAELVANSLLILSAGFKTTVDLLSNTVHELLSHPDQMNLLKENRGLVKSVVEEVLRYRPPLPFFVRVASETFQLRGQTIRSGDVVFLGMAAANRDSQVFPEPDRFDITRDHTLHKHLSFGFGAHHCLGSGLARREIEIALDVLLDRMPELRLDEERPPQVNCGSLLFRGFDSLPLRW